MRFGVVWHHLFVRACASSKTRLQEGIIKEGLVDKGKGV